MNHSFSKGLMHSEKAGISWIVPELVLNESVLLGNGVLPWNLCSKIVFFNSWWFWLITVPYGVTMILCAVVLVRSVVVGDRRIWLHIGNLCGVSFLGNQDFVLETFWKICFRSSGQERFNAGSSVWDTAFRPILENSSWRELYTLGTFELEIPSLV